MGRVLWVMVKTVDFTLSEMEADKEFKAEE